MKRAILYILGITLCLQACHRDSDPSNPHMEEFAIGMFASSVEGTTRALINNATDLTTFCIDGYKVGTVNEQVFAKQVVNRNGMTWEYTPLRYWNTKEFYYFGAYAPQEIAVSNMETMGILDIAAPNWQVIDGTETDIIVATSQGSATEYLNQHAGTVKLDFAHILAQLEVQILRSAFLNNTYKLIGLSYNAVPQENATTTYTLDYTMPANSAMDEVAIAIANKVVYSNDAGVVVTPEVQDVTTFKHLVVPFAATTDGGLQIVVSYTVNDGTPKQSTVKTGVTSLEAGKRYVLKLTFNSGLDITPELVIAEWEDQEVDEDPKYNW